MSINIARPTPKYTDCNGEQVKIETLVLEVQPREQAKNKPIAILLVEKKETYEYKFQNNNPSDATIWISLLVVK